jgi:NADH-quinone oxidoreductase subunit N
MLIAAYANNLIKINNELIALMVLLAIASVTLSTTNHFIMLFVAIELQSLVLYVLFAINVLPANNNNSSVNNTAIISLSYLINAATATGLLLFAIGINNNILLLVTLLWKLGVIPVHVWSIPIIDNLSNIVASIYLTLTKFGTLVVVAIVSSTTIVANGLATYVGMLNLIFGNILGLMQIRYQRIIAFSSLIQVGYLLLVIGNSTSLALTYFQIYALFTVLLLILWTIPVSNISHGATNLPKTQLWILIIVLYSVAGLPFMPLFWTKLSILLAISSQALTVALISTLLSSLIYVRLIKHFAFFSR